MARGVWEFVASAAAKKDRSAHERLFVCVSVIVCMCDVCVCVSV